VDISWIPGQADAVVIAVFAVVAVGGTAVAWVSRTRGAKPEVAPRGVQAPSVAEAPAAGEDSAVVDVDVPEAVETRFSRRRGRVGGALGERLAGFFGRKELGQDAWDELEEALLLADVGAAVTEQIIAEVRARVHGGDESPKEAVRAAILAAIDPDADRTLDVGVAGVGDLAPVVVVGVNGVGKTTTVGKLARVLVAEGYSVVLGAADTFRAAAADQLETWGTRVGVSTVRADADGADPASVAFDATQTAQREGVDVVLIDTAGRLQNKAGLMDQLGKIGRVVTKVAPIREALLVLDATTGQNGLAQARVFAEAMPLTGIVLTKMDGTAKGGIVLAVQRVLGVPVKFVGLGEGADDLAPFDAESFVDGLLGD
jgi:fused signal recognition particle receptor